MMPTNVRRGVVDPFSPDFFSDPYHAFAEARDHLPVQCYEPGTWMVFRHDDVVQVLRDRGLSSTELYTLDAPRNRAILAAGGTETYLLRPSLSKMDAPDHTPLRSMLARLFTPRAVERLRVAAVMFVTDTLDRHAGGDIELINDLAYPMPYQLTCHWLGIPALEDDRDVRRWSFQGLQLIDPFRSTDQFREYIAGGRDFAAYLRDLVDWKRSHLGDDAISQLIAAGEAGDAVTPEEVAATVHTLFLAGFHTTVNQIGLSLLALLRAPEQWAALVADEALLPNAVEELLRFDPTAQFMVRATPTEYQVGGTTIPGGQHVLAWIASANRDEGRWGPTAGILDVRRPDANHHIAFGSGIHSCLGMWLARLELEEVLRALSRHFPGTSLADAEPQWRSTAFMRGLDSLTLHLSA
jgi:cytochrome P450